MPSYLSLINWTDQGARNVKQSPQRLDAAKEAIMQGGGRMIFFYLTMGQYDLVTLTEFPNDDAAARFLLAIGSMGNIRSTTLKAFTEQEFRTLIASLP
jgi:uncharacterized protein with GYD domain